MTALSRLPRTQRPIVEAMLDGILVSRDTGINGGDVFCPRDPDRTDALGRRTSKAAACALIQKGIIRPRKDKDARRPFWRSDLELVPNAIDDDRGR